jgi:hypothetical protein
MDTLKRFGLLVFSIFLTFVGFLKLSSSVEKAQDSTSEYIGSIGGSIDTNTALTITEGYIISNVVTGGVMFLIGLFFLCFSIYLISKKFN